MIKHALGLLGVALVCAGCAQEPAEVVVTEEAESSAPAMYEWTMVTTWPKNLPGMGTSAENLATTIGEMTGGALTIKVYGANEQIGRAHV